MKVLSKNDIDLRLKELHGWELDKNAIKKEWIFENFSAAMRFINQVAEIAENHDHHPELFNVYNRVNLRFNTHSAGCITDKDFRIARDIDAL